MGKGRILIFSAAAALGVVAVRRSRAKRETIPAHEPPRVPAHEPPPVAPETPAAPVSIFKSAEPAADTPTVTDPLIQPAADVDDDDEPPIWAALADSPATTAPGVHAAPAPAFEAALTGAPVQYAASFPPVPPAPPRQGLSALSGEPWASAPLGGAMPPALVETAPAGRQGTGKGVLLSTPRRRKVMAIIGLVVLVALIVATIIVVVA